MAAGIKLAIAIGIAVPVVAFIFMQSAWSQSKDQLAISAAIAQENRESQVAKQIFDLTNQERIKAGITPLVWDDALAETAKTHSQTMYETSNFDHSRTYCKNENIYRIQGSELTASRAVESWMSSAGHRANILNGGFTSIGVGVSGDNTRGYAVQNFC